LSRVGIAFAITSVEEIAMMTILLIVLIIALLASVPAWPYSRGWGYYPSGGIGVVVLLLLLFLFFGNA
jgi:hypothetical protein